MKRLLFSALALILLAAVPAAAATDDNHRHRGGHPQGQTIIHGRQGGGAGQGTQQGGGTLKNRHRDGGNQVYRREPNNRGNDIRRGGFNRGNAPLRNQGIEPRRNRPRDWNVRPRRFDMQIYRRNFEASHRFHWGGYVRPRGWYVHRWTYGERLPRAFWVRDYWINDWWSFDLRTPPYGYEWVRYGDDALLVNIYTGEVLQVEYDLFD
ncbi:MAG TPA: RcnB family protein [Rhizomicrobium sp.]|nr:RcnB family protein [Rhizomicrobium sp.]